MPSRLSGDLSCSRTRAQFVPGAPLVRGVTQLAPERRLLLGGIGLATLAAGLRGPRLYLGDLLCPKRVVGRRHL
jgi:hypothetical protein